MALSLLVLWVVVLVELPVIGRAYDDCEYKYSFVVNNSANNSEPGSLLDALTKALAHNSSVEIRLLSGLFQLPRSEVIYFQEKHEFALVGVSFKETTIVCQDNSGFSFYKSTNLKFVNLTIAKCGFDFTTTSVNLTLAERSNKTSFLKSKTGMLFNLCSNLHFEGVNISKSNGTGITIYNTDGYNYFYNSTICCNNYYCQVIDCEKCFGQDVDCLDECFVRKNEKPFFPGGGGIVIETSHCYPGDTSCNDSVSVVRETRGASYIFENCNFSNNQAYTNEALLSSFPHGTSHMDLGKGGGLAVTLKGQAYNNNVAVRNCIFEDNVGEFGGALHLSFGDTSINNSVSICCGTSFNGNNIPIFGVPYQIIGGAVRITMVSFPEKESKELWDGYVSKVYGNNVSFTDINFSSNIADWGGAVSFTTTRNVPNQRQSNSLHFLRCHFVLNLATLSSSAVDISAWKPAVIHRYERYMIPVFEDCTFIENIILDEFSVSNGMGFGTVYLEDVPSEFRGRNAFQDNTDTPLVISSTSVSISNASVLNFINNTGRRGGALAFIGDAYVVAGEGTQFFFDSNSVGDNGFGLGGAVYAVHFGSNDRNKRQECFFQYYRYGIPPKQWNATFVFKNNKANNELNSIYSTSVAQCRWPAHSSTDDVPANEGAFCDNNTWVFNGEGRDCQNEIFTAPGQISIQLDILNVVPGWTIDLNVNTRDDYNHSTETPLLVSSKNPFKFGGEESNNTLTVSTYTRYIFNNTIIIYGSPGKKGQSLLLSTPEPRQISTILPINVLDCPVGFMPKYCNHLIVNGQVCDCVCITSIPGISCLDTTKKVTISKYHCISQVPNSTIAAVAKCPYNVYKRTLTKIPLSSLSQHICKDFNRTGYLCIDCQSNYGISINTYSYKCVKCKENVKYNWLLFLLLEFGPTTITCFIIVLFRIRVASPYMNGFVFFAQIISVKDFYNSFGWITGIDYINSNLSKPVTLLYGIWNFDFFREFIDICLHPRLNTLNILLINYIRAFYPMTVLLICYICIKLYDRKFQIIRTLWKPFQYCVRIVRGNHSSTTSIIDAFTTLLILSYTKVLYVSFPLVATVNVYNITNDYKVIGSSFFYYFYPLVPINSKYFFYFLIGVITLIIFVGIPPILLLFYSCRLFRAQVGKLNTRLKIALQIFGDSFLSGFKDGTDGGFDCRWFGSVYLIFRVVIFGVYTSQMDWAGQYLAQHILCTLAIFLFAIVHPYKVDFFNFIDISFFVLLSILNGLSTYTSQFIEPHSLNRPNHGVFYLNYILLFVPYVYLLLLLLYLVTFKRLKDVTKRSKKMTRVDGGDEVISDSDHSNIKNNPSDNGNDEFPDRLLHPENYGALNLMPGLSSENKIEQKAGLDKTGLAGNVKDQKKRSDYGSVRQ